MNLQHVYGSVKPISGLLFRVDLSTKKIQIFISNPRLFNITTDEMFLQWILSLISFKRAQQKDFHTGPICTTMSSFFLACKTKTVIWQIRKNKRTIICCLLRKKVYNKKSKDTFFMRLFFRYEWENWCKKCDKKLKYRMSLRNY